jgi:aryl-alcohol dehydrogenase-like predicted oxidoreductase
MNPEKICPIGFGTWGLSGKSYGQIDQNLSLRLLNNAYDRGIRFFDTAPAYGDGLVEELLGRVFVSKSDVFICTKVGLLISENGSDVHVTDRYSVARSVESSLRRLKKDCIDLLMLHSPIFISRKHEEDLYQHLEELKANGKIRNYGISFRVPSDIELYSTVYKDLSAIEMNFSIADQRAIQYENLLTSSRYRIARTPFSYGFLLNEDLYHNFFNPQFDHRHRIRQEVKKYWKSFFNFIENLRLECGISRHELCLRFCLDGSSFNVVIPGIMTEDDLESNLGCLNRNPLSSYVIDKIKDFYANQLDVFGDNSNVTSVTNSFFVNK